MHTTKKQHYIWRKYLIPWTDNNLETGKIFVYRKNPRGTQQVIEQRELMKIGFENYYYDISGFSDKDVSVYKQIIDYMQKDQIVKFDLVLEDLDEARFQKDYIENEIICYSENIENEYAFLDKLKAKDHSFYQDSIGQMLQNSIREEIRYLITHEEPSENFDALHEHFCSYLKMPPEQDTKSEFNLFFWMQYFRSPRIRDNFCGGFEKFKKISNDFLDLNTKFYVNLITIYFAHNVAHNITRNLKSNLIIYENKTSIPFLTGDTPIVTLPGSCDELAIFHYPISPRIAVQLHVSNVHALGKNFTVAMQDKSKVMELNRILCNNCVNEIYSNSKELLLQ